MFNGKANVRPRHRQPLHGIQRGRIFGAGAAQEFAAGGHIAKQIFNANARALRQCGWPLTCHHAMVDRPRPAFGASGPAFQRHFGHAGDGRQSLPPETQSGDHFDIFIRQLRRRVAFQCQRHVRRRHAAAIVGDFDQVDTTCTQPHRNIAGARIDGVFDQLF